MAYVDAVTWIGIAELEIVPAAMLPLVIPVKSVLLTVIVIVLPSNIAFSVAPIEVLNLNLNLKISV